MGSIKVRDIVNITEQQIEKITKAINTLQGLTDRYSKMTSTTDLESLELLKREFVGNLTYYTDLYGLIKKHKGVNHAYFEDTIKRVKAETMDILLNSIDPSTNKLNTVTSAERRLYQHPYYTDRLEIIQRLKQTYERADALHEVYQGVLQAIVQSVSVAAKEFNNTKATN